MAYSLDPPAGFEVSAEQRTKVLARLNTDEESLLRDAEALRSWVNMQPHLPFLPAGELDFLKSYLLNSKNSLEKAKQGLDTYFTARTAHYELYGKFNLNNKEMSEYGQYMQIGMSKELTSDLRRVLVVHISPKDQTEEQFIRMCRINLIKADVVMRVDTNLGFELILDLSDFSPNHAKIMALSVSTMKNYLNCTLGALPARVKNLHFVNAPSVFTATFPVIQHLLKEKLRQRIHVHNSLKSLYSFVSPRCLPREMGGDLPSYQEMEADLGTYFCTLGDFYAFQRAMKTDESRRPGGPSQMFSDTFGCEGSFRKLALD